MLISCEKCSTTYTLEDSMIPDQGAPVQCTRCGNVFTAKKATAPVAASLKAPAQTMMFAAPAPDPASVPTAPPPNPQPQKPMGTMIFGAGDALPPEALPTVPPPAAKPMGTMVFGAAVVPESNVVPNKAPAQTMMFAAAQPAPKPEPSAPKPPSSTMVFGAAEKTVPHSTMMFGATEVPAPDITAPNPSQTVRSTMVFGGLDSASADNTVRMSQDEVQNMMQGRGAPIFTSMPQANPTLIDPKMQVGPTVIQPKTETTAPFVVKAPGQRIGQVPIRDREPSPSETAEFEAALRAAKGTQTMKIVLVAAIVIVLVALGVFFLDGRKSNPASPTKTSTKL